MTEEYSSEASKRVCVRCEQICKEGAFHFPSIRRRAEGRVPLQTFERRRIFLRNLGGTAELFVPISVGRMGSFLFLYANK